MSGNVRAIRGSDPYAVLAEAIDDLRARELDLEAVLVIAFERPADGAVHTYATGMHWGYWGQVAVKAMQRGIENMESPESQPHEGEPA